MIELFPSRSVALSLFSFSIHWYGILYAVALIIGILLLPKLQRYRNLSLDEKQRSDLATYVFLGVLIGGRLGYVLLYDPLYYAHHPIDILKVWHGGMASHGGMTGVILAVLLFARRHSRSALAIGDVLVVPIAIGLALGRLGNFINGELYGTVSSLPWAMSFPGVSGLRHPTQLYAVAKDLSIALLCMILLFATSSNNQRKTVPHGYVLSAFLIAYGILRIAVEYFRDQPFGFVHLGALSISRGQLYSLPVLLCGIGLAITLLLRMGITRTRE